MCVCRPERQYTGGPVDDDDDTTLGAKTAPRVGRPGHGDHVVALFALAQRVVVHLCAHRVFVVHLARVVLETLVAQPCNQQHARAFIRARQQTCSSTDKFGTNSSRFSPLRRVHRSVS